MRKAWFSWFELGCAGVAAALLYVLPQAGAWPILIALVPWVLRPFVAGELLPRSPFDLPLLLFLLTAGAAVWSAYDRDAAWAKFWLIVAAVLLFYAVAGWVRATSSDAEDGDVSPAAWLPALLATAVALYFFVTHDWETFPAPVAALTAVGKGLQTFLPRLDSHRMHPNVVGGLLALGLPFALVLLRASVRRRARLPLLLTLATVGLILAGLLFAGSRGAWLATAVAAVLALWWGIAGRVGGGRRRLVFAGGLGAVALVGLLGVLIWPETAVGLLARLPGFGDGLSRMDLYRSSLPLAADYPFIGAGLDSFLMLYSSYALLLHVGYLVHAHNLYLNVAIEQGAFGLLALLWMWLLVGLMVWREMGRGRVRPLAAAAALSLVTILVHGLLDDALYGSRGVLLLFLPLAYTAVLPEWQTARATRRRQALVALGVAAVLIAAIGVVRPLRALVYSNLGAVAQSQAELSVYAWPEWPIQDAVRRAVDETTAVAQFERALAVNPRNVTANRRMGQLSLSLGAYGAALDHLQVAYAARPWDGATRQLLGEALIVNGRVDEGAQLWQTVNPVQDQLLVRRYWYEFIGDAESVAAIDAALERR